MPLSVSINTYMFRCNSLLIYIYIYIYIYILLKMLKVKAKLKYVFIKLLNLVKTYQRNPKNKNAKFHDTETKINGQCAN